MSRTSPVRFARRLLAALIIPALASAATPAFAYGVYGHNTIARIALANVKPATLVALKALAARARRVDTPMCKTKAIDDLSVWPDCIRGLGPRFSYTASWHYQNVNVCAEFDLKPPCRDGNCVSAQVDRDVKILQDKTIPVRERAAALSFLIHFVGDMHMPLHAGDHADQGGNQIKADFAGFTTDRLNLHGIWDGLLAERAIMSGPSMIRRYEAAEAADLQAGTTEEWSHEAWLISRDVTYPSAVGADYCARPTPEHISLDEPTIVRLLPIARLQIERAGLRLARLLDEAFSEA